MAVMLQDAVLWVMTLCSPVQCLWTCFSLSTSLNFRFHISIFDGDVIFIYKCTLTRTINVTKCKDFLLNKFFFYKHRRSCQHKFRLFISLSDMYESVANPDPEVRSSGMVQNVPLYCTTRPDLWIRICHSHKYIWHTPWRDFTYAGSTRQTLLEHGYHLRGTATSTFTSTLKMTVNILLCHTGTAQCHNTQHQTSKSVLHFFYCSILLKLALPSSFPH
jgi:hypothetical protein